MINKGVYIIMYYWNSRDDFWEIMALDQNSLGAKTSFLASEDRLGRRSEKG